MPGNLDPSVATKLAKVCGLLGSDHGGERAAAAAAATRILRDHGTTWADLVRAGAGALGTTAPARDATLPQEIARHILLGKLHLLSPWEVQFTQNLARWRGHVTPKQAARLAQLCADLETRGTGR